MIDIRTALELAMQELSPLNSDSRLEAEILLGHLLNKNRAYLFAHPEALISPAQSEAYKKLISQRAKGIPIAYLTGQREFWSLPLKVNTHTRTNS